MIDMGKPKTTTYATILVIALLLAGLFYVLTTNTEGIDLFGSETAPEGLEVFEITEETEETPPPLPGVPLLQQ